MTGPGCLPTACPVCGAATATPVVVVGGYTIVRCDVCGTEHVRPMPADDVLFAHYQDPAYYQGPGDQGYRDYARVAKALIPLFRRRLGEIDRRVSVPGRLLDFGSAAGYFLEVAKAEGWEATGVEISAQMAMRSSERTGARVVASVDDLGDERFDVIAMWEVLEHLSQPLAVLEDLQGRLRPGGVLALSTPNTGHWQALREPQDWEGYRPPSHLVFYTRDTLAAALHRAGFQRVEIQGTAPLPMLPAWLSRASQPLRAAVASGEARPWLAALLAWRAVRAFGLVWQRLAYPGVDIFATLEAWAIRT